jgi:hypothetical protein
VRLCDGKESGGALAGSGFMWLPEKTEKTDCASYWTYQHVRRRVGEVSECARERERESVCVCDG